MTSKAIKKLIRGISIYLIACSGLGVFMFAMIAITKDLSNAGVLAIYLFAVALTIISIYNNIEILTAKSIVSELHRLKINAIIAAFQVLSIITDGFSYQLIQGPKILLKSHFLHSTRDVYIGIESAWNSLELIFSSVPVNFTMIGVNLVPLIVTILSLWLAIITKA